MWRHTGQLEGTRGRAGAAKHPDQPDNHGQERPPNRRLARPPAGRSTSRSSLTTTRSLTSGPPRSRLSASRLSPGTRSPTGQRRSQCVPGRPSGRATSVPFTAAPTSLQRTTTDNARARSTSAVPCHRRSRSCPNWLCKQEVAGSNLAVPTTSYGRLADGTTHKQAVLPIL
jgi:hypothetical protein